MKASPRMTGPSLAALIAADRRANRNGRIRLVLLTFRLAHAARTAGPLGMPVRALHRFLTEWCFSMELPASVEAGPGLKIEHGYGLVVHPRVVLGSGVVLKHGVTLGINGPGGAPVIGDGVVFGPGSQVLGAVRVGDRSRVAAAAVVLADVPSDSVAVGIPARSRPLFSKASPAGEPETAAAL
jgi:putative colanic acid biosynthesis acetyltransferase WcaB